MTSSPLNQPNMQPFDGSRPIGAQSKHVQSADPALAVKSAPPTAHSKLETQVKNWVGQTFFGTLMKQMRDSPFKSDLFSGGRGEQAFGSMYDGQLAQHMAQGLGARIARPMIKKLEKQAAAAYEKNKKQTFMQKEQFRANSRA